ncbi:MAG: phosphatidylglycerophosphatase A [candidate division Zixibacteria bacterium]|nr:phosphatidylglycerophosphatase A [candidate division Zixibacteria bacterium]
MKQLVNAIATGLYTGYFPILPGSFGTIPAWVIAWFWLGKNDYYLVAAAIITTIISVWSANKAEKFLGHDAKKIVIDEWAGMFITLLFLPYRLDVYIAAFVFFRFYDVVKPYPAGRCEKLPGGWGITFDDVFAGVYANLTCWLCIIVLQKLHWLGF